MPPGIRYSDAGAFLKPRAKIVLVVIPGGTANLLRKGLLGVFQQVVNEQNVCGSSSRATATPNRLELTRMIRQLEEIGKTSAVTFGPWTAGQAYVREQFMVCLQVHDARGVTVDIRCPIPGIAAQ